MPASMEQFHRRITVNIDDSHMRIYSSSRAVAGENVAGIEHLRKKEIRHVISVKEARKRKDRRDSKEEIEHVTILQKVGAGIRWFARGMK
jgi:hypothetical protein